MAKIQVKLNRRGVALYLKSPTMKSEMLRRAQRIAAAAGPGHEASAIIGKSRARASVITATPAAIRGNAQNQTLLRALGGQRRG
ncbi:hypothetical protein [Kocuria rosea]|uniref:hypothetical protein n=1 Tax=Kocuria rosea TaxID=1275 RepID=UPI003D3527D3